MTNKILLVAIALGLWANVIATWVRPALGGEVEDTMRQSMFAVMYNDIEAMANGTCRNTKIC